jgi:hypothetical protein
MEQALTEVDEPTIGVWDWFVRGSSASLIILLKASKGITNGIMNGYEWVMSSRK